MHTVCTESLETDLFLHKSVVDLGLQPESLTPKPEILLLYQADSHGGYGVNEEAGLP